MNEYYALVKWYCHGQPKYLENNPSQLPLWYKFHISWILHNCRYSLSSFGCTGYVGIWQSLAGHLKQGYQTAQSAVRWERRLCSETLHSATSHVETWISVQITFSFSKLVLADSVFQFLPVYPKFPTQQNSILNIRNRKMQCILSYDNSRNIPFKHSSVTTHPTCIIPYTYHCRCCNCY